MRDFTVFTSRRRITVEAANGAAAIRRARRQLERGEVIISCALAYESLQGLRLPNRGAI